MASSSESGSDLSPVPRKLNMKLLHFKLKGLEYDYMTEQKNSLFAQYAIEPITRCLIIILL